MTEENCLRQLFPWEDRTKRYWPEYLTLSRQVAGIPGFKGSTSFDAFEIVEVVKMARRKKYEANNVEEVRETWGRYRQKRRGSGFIPSDDLGALGYPYYDDESVGILKLTGDRYASVWVGHCNSSGSCVDFVTCRIAGSLADIQKYGLTDKQR
eukprot:CAMPEP_0174263540 /NCGR_PEP_ID=MMETSP0439-20130205/19118_1 /TAXON_ID=0 /ORGANISM="Stereomyxa ramosa, Strain Chinc5" /LENGTH=152 /DNA_ID=CAMNT_0015348937 /DNA_START=18 /DNA_END=473 /DNA_ORIENTATION=-